MKHVDYRNYLLTLLIAYLALWIMMAIEPLYPEDWLLENILVFIALPLLVSTYRYMPLSRLSYTLIFIFMCMHTIGSHYTYAEVPYNEWSAALFGTSINELFGWERNHYDRLVHLCYGLLLAYPIRELFCRVANVQGFWGYFLPLDLTMSTSMLYEIVEWGAALVVGGDLGMAYLGTQGDVWDAHKDMALASLGAAITMLVIMAINARMQKDFNREWVESLRVKHHAPLGEDGNNRL